jgi:hypothetical protein
LKAAKVIMVTPTPAATLARRRERYWEARSMEPRGAAHGGFRQFSGA